MKSVVERGASLVSIATFAVCCSAIAEDSSLKVHNAVSVRVRTLEAFDSVGAQVKELPARAMHYEIDKDIKDLSSKLKQLHFRKYKLRSSTNRDMVFDKQEVLDLGDGYKLAMKPLYRDKDKLCLWVEWTDGSGMKIINTRLHMNTRESMVTGTDQGDDGGMILAIDVNE